MNNLIARGSFGSVYRVDESTIEKKMDLFDILTDDEPSALHDRNIKEAIFLNSFKAPFIPKCHQTTIRDKKIFLREQYCGITLTEYAKKLTYIQRIEMLPVLMCQMARILVWLKRHKIAHMDIKPDNLCINENNELTLIDFGFVAPVCKNSPRYTGTPLLGDPNAIRQKRQTSYAYDMFGMGMTIFYFLNKRYADDLKWKRFSKFPPSQANIFSEVRMKYNEISISTVIGDKILNLLKKMILLDEDERIKPYDLYGSSAFKNLWEKYPLYTVDRVEKYFPEFQSMVEVKYLDILFDWFRMIAIKNNGFYYMGIAIKLICRLSECNPIPLELFQLYGIACIYISTILMGTRAVDLEYCEYICGGIYSQENIANAVVEILAYCDWNIYPDSGGADWDIPHNKIVGYDEYFKAYYNFNFVRKPEFLKRIAFKEYTRKN